VCPVGQAAVQCVLAGVGMQRHAWHAPWRALYVGIAMISRVHARGSAGWGGYGKQPGPQKGFQGTLWVSSRQHVGAERECCALWVGSQTAVRIMGAKRRHTAIFIWQQ
jgi:hypothetical protein